MKWQSARSLSLRRLTISCLIMATIVQLTVLAAPAAANMPDREDCTYDGKLVPEDFPGARVYWVCHIVGGRRWWSIFDILEGPDLEKTTRFAASTPPYSSYVTAGIGQGYGNGVAVASYSLRNPNDTELVRDIAVRFIVHNRTTGGTCSDTGWVGTNASRKTIEVARDYPGTCGGSGYFETSAAGRFWSLSLDKWITNAWVQSGRLWLSNCCAPERSSKSPQPPRTDAP